MKALLIPFKDPSFGKTRLRELLSSEERSALALAMFEDVARAASRASQPDRVVLVSSYRPTIERAKQLGWEVLVEESQQSESASVDWASRVLQERGFDLVMRLPADVPLVQSSDIDLLLTAEIKTPGALLVPSRDGTGTNAIVRTPPTLFPSRFGPDSLALHRNEVVRAGAKCRVIANERIALDIDEPSDLELLLELGAGTEAGRVASVLRNKWATSECNTRYK